ncbi:hypothetical protein CS063_04070 [Sporanaerobium hydrogeniformans]|uniref:Uncharacterized protein n=1 Tax=Sporanaerobium hydrogeniformans TaxID=3072179 RepID=A0AC61DFL4_9FIRM|nr:hypothetical protein [Sporanaerobium hydrogeniformans]PHV71742.1 hypothetical protein CS063_04070 [Sporanaerobium hydrogeniformans]
MFKFELESVLSLKGNIEDTKKRELGLANREKEILVSQKEALLKEYNLVCQNLKKEAGENVNIQALKVSRIYADYMLKKNTRKKNFKLKKL